MKSLFSRKNLVILVISLILSGVFEYRHEVLGFNGFGKGLPFPFYSIAYNDTNIGPHVLGEDFSLAALIIDVFILALLIFLVIWLLDLLRHRVLKKKG